MGYTHYHSEMKRPLNKGEVGVIKKIIKASKVKIVGGMGEEGTKPIVEYGVIKLNGLGDDSHETLWINTGKGDFCKTNRKPYDVVVVAILHYLSQQGVLTWSSDGKEEDHFDGMRLVKSVVGDNLSQKGV